MVMKVVGAAFALWTCPVLAAGHQTLLGIIRDIGGKDGVNAMDLAVARGHLNAVLPGLDKWLEQMAHCSMEDALLSSGIVATGKAWLRRLLDGKVANKYARLLRRFATEVARDIPEGEVYWIRLFVAPE